MSPSYRSYIACLLCVLLLFCVHSIDRMWWREIQRGCRKPIWLECLSPEFQVICVHFLAGLLPLPSLASPPRHFWKIEPQPFPSPHPLSSATALLFSSQTTECNRTPLPLRAIRALQIVPFQNLPSLIPLFVVWLITVKLFICLAEQNESKCGGNY